MATENCRILRQGNCKNAFCNAKLPADKTTIIKPPSGNPDTKKDDFWLLKKTLYGLGCSPQHWYRLVTSILADMGIQPRLRNPCLFHDMPSNEASPASSTYKPLHIGIYVDNFAYFSEDTSIEQRFERLLASKLRVEFMGTLNWFLGTHFEWSSHQDGALSCHLSREAYAQNNAERYRLADINFNPLATPYQMVCPINATPSETSTRMIRP